MVAVLVVLEVHCLGGRGKVGKVGMEKSRDVVSQGGDVDQ